MSKVKQPQKLASERQIAMRHVWYEWTMLIRTCGMLRKYNDADARSSLEKGMYSAILESFVVHFRNLYEFLFEDSDAKEVRAVDYLGGGDVALKSLKSPILIQWFGEAQVQIHHIGYGRNWAKPEQRGWPFVDLARNLSRAFACFLRSAQFEGSEACRANVDSITALNLLSLPPTLVDIQDHSTVQQTYEPLTATTTANTPTTKNPLAARSGP